MKFNFLEHKRNIYSQNGEDGIIAAIFDMIDFKSYLCCEFGAWDGIHLSNTRNLILNGLKGVLIEGDAVKFSELTRNYQEHHNVICIHRNVDTRDNRLKVLLSEAGLANLDEMDFLSIDIDGLDYEIFESLDFKPRVICVEVNAGHEPNSTIRLDPRISSNNVGQPFGLFCDTARQANYGLVGYSGNAFFIRNDVLREKRIDELSNEEAYLSFLNALNQNQREWLYLVNLGLVPPYYVYNNKFLNESTLMIERSRAQELIDSHHK